MSAKTAQDWTDAANERVQDADILKQHRPKSIGSIYIAGYIIELYLKGYWVALGKVPPKIHNLRELWLGANLRLSDIKDANGAKAFFLTDWSVAYRYESSISTTFSTDELLEAAKQMAGWINMQIRRQNLKTGGRQ